MRDQVSMGGITLGKLVEGEERRFEDRTLGTSTSKG